MRWNRAIPVLILVVTLLPRAFTQLDPTVRSRDQLQQYVTQLQANPSDDALRAKIIQLALTLDPKPANPPDLLETIGAATYAFKNAQSETDMVNAANLYGKALLLAPWRADLYYDDGLSEEKAKRLDDAIKAFQFYLLAAPNATDADDMKEKIGALKYQVAQQQDHQRAAQVEQDAQAAALRRQQEMQRQSQNQWGGIWRMTGGTQFNVHTRNEYEAKHVTFEINSDEIVEQWCIDRGDARGIYREGQSFSYNGRLQGGVATFDDGDTLEMDQNGSTIRVTNRMYGDSGPDYIFSRVNDQALISASCNR